jgi:hypothetical protein
MKHKVLFADAANNFYLLAHLLFCNDYGNNGTDLGLGSQRERDNSMLCPEMTCR